MRVAVLACVVAIGGCNTSAPPHEVADPEPAIVTTSSGAVVELPIDVATDHEIDGARESFRSTSGAVWSVQTLEPTPGADPATTLEQIAIALCRRVELGEVEGELTHRDCQFAGQAGQCIEGWQNNPAGERILRRGAIVRAGSDVVWISLAVRADEGSVDRLAEALANETSVRGGT